MKAVLKTGETVTITGHSGGAFRVFYGGNTKKHGWVAASEIKTLKASSDDPSVSS